MKQEAKDQELLDRECITSSISTAFKPSSNSNIFDTLESGDIDELFKGVDKIEANLYKTSKSRIRNDAQIFQKTIAEDEKIDIEEEERIALARALSESEYCEMENKIIEELYSEQIAIENSCEDDSIPTTEENDQNSDPHRKIPLLKSFSGTTLSTPPMRQSPEPKKEKDKDNADAVKPKPKLIILEDEEILSPVSDNVPSVNVIVKDEHDEFDPDFMLDPTFINKQKEIEASIKKRKAEDLLLPTISVNKKPNTAPSTAPEPKINKKEKKRRQTYPATKKDSKKPKLDSSTQTASTTTVAHKQLLIHSFLKRK